MLAVSDLWKCHAGREVLRGVSVQLRAGERVALLGPSGCGKTTLLNCIGAVDKADRGTVRIGDRDITALSSDEMAQVRRTMLGTVFQFFHLLPTMTARENVELPLKLLRVAQAERHSRVQGLLERVGLEHRADALPGEMSGGEMQRVAIARAVVHRPQLILADEPTGNLDSATGTHVLRLLEEICTEHSAALLMVTHSEDAAQSCHRVLRMKDGLITDA